MENNPSEINKLRDLIKKSRELYSKEGEIWCPYFKEKVVLNSDGFNHLLNKPNRLPRNINEQILKLSLLKKAVSVIRVAGTIQEIRTVLQKVGEPSLAGFYNTKKVQYWGLHAILGQEKLIKIVVVIKKIGDGKPIFWSVLPYKRFNNQKLYSDEIIDE